MVVVVAVLGVGVGGCLLSSLFHVLHKSVCTSHSFLFSFSSSYFFKPRPITSLYTQSFLSRWRSSSSSFFDTGAAAVDWTRWYQGRLYKNSFHSSLSCVRLTTNFREKNTFFLVVDDDDDDVGWVTTIEAAPTAQFLTIVHDFGTAEDRALAV